MVKNSKIPIAVIGAGFLGEFHIQQILRIDDFQLIGIYDNDRRRLEQIGSKYKVKIFSTLDEALSNSPAVSVVAPTGVHHDIAVKALGKGCDVFIEKPISDCVENANQIIGAHKQGQIVQVGHIERYNAAFIELSRHRPSPKFIEAHRLSTYSDRGTEVSVIHDLMIHDIDIANALIASPVEHISATGVGVISNTIDIANARIAYKSGAVANITASRISNKKMRKMRLFEKDRYFSINFLRNILEKHFINKNDTDVKTEKYVSDNYNALYYELVDFASSIKHSKPPSVGIDSAVRALSVAESIEKIILENQ